jgi:DNA-binding transcriptional LysR family regulator
VETAAIEVRISAFNFHPLAAQLDVLVEERAGLEAATGNKSGSTIHVPFFHRARWHFLEGNATDRQWFRGTAIVEPLYTAPAIAAGGDGAGLLPRSAGVDILIMIQYYR